MTDTATSALTDIADRAAADITADFPGVTAYDLYIETLGDGSTLGVVDMGDVYRAAFEWRDGGWCVSWLDPAAVRDWIIRHRERSTTPA